MFMNICALSGVALQDPVVSKKSGHIFERRLIEKQIEATGQCPITNQDLQLSDLIPLQVNKQSRPRQLQANSIPELLTTFQNEWDALMLETYSLKEQLQTVRQELSHALYQHDAACRVIARINKEKEHYKQQIQNLEQQQQTSTQMEEEKQFSLPSEIISQITEKAFELNSQRKEKKKLKEKAFDNYKNQDQIMNFKQTINVQLHAAQKKGINCLDVNQNYILTGGNDGNALLFSKENQQVLYILKIQSTLSGHKKKINDVAFVQSDKIQALVCSDDNKASLFDCSQNKGLLFLIGKIVYKIENHKQAITGCAIHPLGYLGVVCSQDEHFSFHDLYKGQMINQVKLQENSSQFNCVKIHPDGHVMALGASDGCVKIWNLTDDSLIDNLKAHQAQVDLLCFSENGYYFATGSKQENVISIWDLRNQIRAIQSIEAPSLGSLCFDPSGQQFAVGLNKIVKVYSTKSFECYTSFEPHSSQVSDIKWGEYSSFIASVGQDRFLSLFE